LQNDRDRHNIHYAMRLIIVCDDSSNDHSPSNVFHFCEALDHSEQLTFYQSVHSHAQSHSFHHRKHPCFPSPRLTLRVRVVAHDTQNQTLPSRCRASYASGLRPFDDVTDVSKVESKERTTQIDHPGQGYVGESLGVSTGKPALL